MKCVEGYKIMKDGVRLQTYAATQSFVRRTGWIGNDGNNITNLDEISRLNEESVSAPVVNPHYHDDHLEFKQRVFVTGSLTGLPVDCGNIIINWADGSPEGVLNFSGGSLFEGDDIYVIVRNMSSVKKRITMPGGNASYVHSNSMEIEPGSAISINISYMNGLWHYDLKNRGTSPLVSNFVIQNGLWIMSGLWIDSEIWSWNEEEIV